MFGVHVLFWQAKSKEKLTAGENKKLAKEIKDLNKELKQDLGEDKEKFRTPVFSTRSTNRDTFGDRVFKDQSFGLVSL